MQACPPLATDELLRHALSLAGSEVFVVSADGLVCRPHAGAGPGDLARSARASVFDVYGGTPEANAKLERVLAGADGEIAFRLERELQMYQVRARALRDERGRPAGAVGVATLATERQELERALAASESRASQLIDSNMVGVLFWERSGAVTGANDALLSLLGYSRADLETGEIDWRALTPPEYHALDDAALREIDERGVCTPFEKEYVRKDGRRIPVLLGGASAPDHQSGVCFVVDQSARRAQEQRRYAAEAQLRHAVSSAPFVLWSVDASGIFTLSEGRGLTALGLRPGQVVGMSAFEFYKDVPQIVEGLRRGLAGGTFTETVEVSGRIFETQTFHLSDADGRSAGMVGLSLDVTERQQAEAERMKLQAKLLEMQRRESLGVMAGGMAHDFNNILTVILGNASTALLALPEGSVARDDVAAVVAAAQRAADLTRQMLAYAGRGQFDVRRLDVSVHVRDIVALVRRTLPPQVQLHLELGRVPAIMADAAQLEQVIMNLLLNAAEAIGDAPGHVIIMTSETQLTERDERRLSTDQEIAPGRYVLLEVRDSGSGMDPATLKRIFDPFFTTKFTGRGLGLAAVLGIVRAHAGAIFVDTALGEGSTFEVLLPSCEDAAR